MYSNGSGPADRTRCPLHDVTAVRGRQGYLVNVYASPVAFACAQVLFLCLADAPSRAASTLVRRIPVIP